MTGTAFSFWWCVSLALFHFEKRGFFVASIPCLLDDDVSRHVCVLVSVRKSVSFPLPPLQCNYYYATTNSHTINGRISENPNGISVPLPRIISIRWGDFVAHQNSASIFCCSLRARVCWLLVVQKSNPPLGGVCVFHERKRERVCGVGDDYHQHQHREPPRHHTIATPLVRCDFFSHIPCAG